jgi:ribosomal protein S18 acetylase RimI-like enzyme
VTSVVGDDAAAVLAGHRDRLRTVDPLLPDSEPLPAPATGDTPLAAPGAVGLERRMRTQPDELQATWGALDQRWLLARVVDPAAMAALLGRWREHLAGPDAPPGPDSAAIVAWPSRDLPMIPVFVAHGLVPDHVIAVRPAGRPTVGTPADVRVRRAEPADLDAVVALRMAEVDYSIEVSGLARRPNTAALMRDRYAAALAVETPWVWLADRDGQSVGLISVTTGDEAAWIAPQVAATPVAYVDCAAVAPAHRGGGVATALIRHVHDAADQAGIAVTLLHHSPLNPLSTPFWHRSGYRPLRTRWQVSPAR